MTDQGHATAPLDGESKDPDPQEVADALAHYRSCPFAEQERQDRAAWATIDALMPDLIAAASVLWNYGDGEGALVWMRIADAAEAAGLRVRRFRR